MGPGYSSKMSSGKITEVVSACNCNSPEFLASFVDCITRASLNQNDLYKAMRIMPEKCKKYNPNLSIYTLDKIYANATDNNYFINVGSSQQVAQAKKNINYNPIKLSNEFIVKVRRSYSSGYYVKYTGLLYGGLLNAYFGGILVAGTVANFLRKSLPVFFMRSTNTKQALWLRQKLTNPALFGYKHNMPVKFGWLVNMSLPTRAQFWVLAGYFCMVIIFMFIRYDLFDGNIRLQSRSRQLSFYVAYRSGIMAVAHLPLVVTFAGRNNIWSWLTGWSFDTLNIYHRWLARVMYTLAFIHSIGFTVFYHLGHKYTQEFHHGFFRWGAVAITSGGIVLFFSLRHFREHVYDVFLAIHWVFVSIFFAGVWWHLDDLHNKEWIYTSIALWAFDRFMRLVRIAFSSINSVADFEIYKSPQLIKLKIAYSNFWEPQPGNYVFIHFVDPIWSIIHNHPFSCYPSPRTDEEDKLILCMKVRNGKTKRLAQYLSQKLQPRQKVRILLDGPYGHTFPLTNNQTIILLAGGIGITAIYSYACRLLDQAEKKHIIMIWVIQDTEILDVFDNEITFLKQKHSIDINIYVTKEKRLDNPSLDSAQTNEKTKLDNPDSPTDYFIEPHGPEYSSVDQQEVTHINYSSRHKLITKHREHTISLYRPKIDNLVETLITESPGTIAFLACGPPRFNDDVRKAVTDQMGKGNGRIDLFLESYNW